MARSAGPRRAAPRRGGAAPGRGSRSRAGPGGTPRGRARPEPAIFAGGSQSPAVTANPLSGFRALGNGAAGCARGRPRLRAARGSRGAAGPEAARPERAGGCGSPPPSPGERGPARAEAGSQLRGGSGAGGGHAGTLGRRRLPGAGGGGRRAAAGAGPGQEGPVQHAPHHHRGAVGPRGGAALLPAAGRTRGAGPRRFHAALRRRGLERPDG